MFTVTTVRFLPDNNLVKRKRVHYGPILQLHDTTVLHATLIPLSMRHKFITLYKKKAKNNPSQLIANNTCIVLVCIVLAIP